MKARAEDRLVRANAPGRHRNLRNTRTDGEWGKWYTALETLRQDVGTGCTVAIVGPRGRGKTQLAVEIMRELSRKEDPAISLLYSTTYEFYAAIRRSYGKERERGIPSEYDIVTHHSSVGLLVLDEIRLRPDSDWEHMIFAGMLDKRYREELDTILVGNPKASELQQYVGHTVYERMRETGAIIEATWPSFRDLKS